MVLLNTESDIPEICIPLIKLAVEVLGAFKNKLEMRLLKTLP